MDALTSDEAAKGLRVHQQTIGVLIRSGVLKAKKRRGIWLVDRVSYEAELKRRKEKGRHKQRKSGPRLRPDRETEIKKKLDAIGFDPRKRPKDSETVLIRTESVSKALTASRRTTRLSAQAVSKFAGFAINYVYRVEKMTRAISREAVSRIAIVIRAAGGNPQQLVDAFSEATKTKTEDE